MPDIFVSNKDSKFSRNNTTIHCRNNKIKLVISLRCEKCQSQDRWLTKRFDTINSLCRHLISRHSGNNCYKIPTKFDCIKKLQKFSDSLNEGVLNN